MYKIGNRMVEIHRDVISKLLEWNSDEQKNNSKFDFAFCLSVLLSLVSPAKIAESGLSPDVVAFIHGKKMKNGEIIF